MGVFKDLAIQELNQEITTAPKCSACGGDNQTASNFCFTCVSKYGNKTCVFCGVSVGSTGGFKCHEECADWQVYCGTHIKKYKKTCDFCGVFVGSTGEFNHHDGCANLDWQVYIKEYKGGVK